MKNPKNLFKDPLNPTKEELKKWAYGNFYAPEQDFELCVVDDPNLILSFASDETCPQRKFFLGSLYIWVGDQVKNGIKNEETLLSFLNNAEEVDDEKIEKFVDRSKNLINNPETYDYSKWGLGGSYTKE